MARSCGLRIGPRRFELVVLDGGAKKHKITAYMAGELPRDADDPIASAAAILRDAVKQHNVPLDNVGVAIDTGLAAFRTLKVPFADKDKIEDVLKFEVESQLPQWNVDDVVADFMVLESTGDSSELLVTAVPKADLRNIISICEKAGIEPLEAELETTAMVNAAMTGSLCTVDNAQVLVHIGETSTSVVVMDGGKVREMRAIHIGAMSHEFPATAVEPEAGVEGADAAVTPEVQPTVDPVEIQRRLDQAIKRIRRELGRTVSAARTVHPIDGVYVCGLELPGLAGSRILDAEVRVLDVFEADGGQPAQGFGPLVVAYGVAVRLLGGGTLRPSLRREELRYSGAFERVELPLAVVALLAVTFLGVWFIFLSRERDAVNDNLGFWRDTARAYVLGEPAKGRPGYLQYPSDRAKDYITNIAQDEERGPFDQIRRANTILQDDIKKLEKDLGQDAEIKQPQSAFTGMTLVLETLGKQVGGSVRPSLRTVQATYQAARSQKPEHVKVDLNMSFLADDSYTATQAFDNFTRDVRAEPWFLEFSSRQSDPVEGGRGIYLGNVSIDVDVSKVSQLKDSQ
ncbi:MAG: pilus assembly protein PilM [Planctomycetes bacterium]|nr:pilus assembly protein PilM [Planctomycetota bacterium]